MSLENPTPQETKDKLNSIIETLSKKNEKNKKIFCKVR
jgi:hypothetical protein